MTYTDLDGEGTLELNTMELFKSLGWVVSDCYSESFGVGATLGRDNSAQVVLESRLREAIAKLNPGLSTPALDLAVTELVKDRSVLSPVRANQEVYQLLKDGVKVGGMVMYSVSAERQTLLHLSTFQTATKAPAKLPGGCLFGDVQYATVWQFGRGVHFRTWPG